MSIHSAVRGSVTGLRLAIIVFCFTETMFAQAPPEASSISLQQAASIALEKNPLRKAAIAESGDRISVRANVLGFEENELRISVEPHVTILGKKGISATECDGGKVEYIDWCPDQILKRIELAADVIPESSVVELQAGLLNFELVKAAGRKAKSADAA